MLIDHFLPMYEQSKRYATIIHASAEEVYSALKESDINESRIIRFLFLLRGLPALFSESRRKTLTLKDITASGFLLLGEKPNEEIVIGIIGQFWKLTGNICKTARSEHFIDFNEPNFAKAAWNFVIKEHGAGRVELSTETRIHCIGKKSQKKFRRYWRVVGPFSGIIRKEILKIVKRNAEQVLEGENNYEQ